MGGRALCLAIRTVEVDGGRRFGPGPGPVIASVDPQPAGLGAAAAGIEYGDRRVVGKQLGRSKHMGCQAGLQGLQPPTRAADPVRQGRAVDLDAVPGEDLALPVKWQVIAVLGDQDMSEKTGTGEALGDWTLRGGRLMNGPAGPAAITRPANANNPKPGGHMIEHLADGLADHMQLAAAAGASLMLKIEPDVLTGLMRGQAWLLGSHSRCLGCHRWKGGFDPRDVGVEVVEAELQLVVIQPFGAPAKLAALQLLNDEPEPFDLRLRFGEVDAFGRERPDHPLQRVYIIRQSGKIDVHEQAVYTDSRASSPMHMPVESIGRSDYSVRFRRKKARQLFLLRAQLFSLYFDSTLPRTLLQ